MKKCRTLLIGFYRTLDNPKVCYVDGNERGVDGARIEGGFIEGEELAEEPLGGLILFLADEIERRLPGLRIDRDDPQSGTKRSDDESKV